MKASDCKMNDLKTVDQCLEAIESIELDYRNTLGGRYAFFSGCKTELTKAAAAKIKAINAKLMAMPETDDQGAA